MLTALFFLGTWPFWVLAAIVFFVIVALEENEKEYWAAAAIVVYLAAIWKFGGVNIIAAITGDWKRAGLILGGGILAGVAWGIVKVVVFIDAGKRFYRDKKEQFLREHEVQGKDVPDHLRKAWSEAYARSFSQSYGKSNRIARIPICIGDHKRRIIRWMMFWPFSIFWTVLDDFVTKFWRRVFDFVRGFLQSLADRLTSKERSELGSPD